MSTATSSQPTSSKFVSYATPEADTVVETFQFSATAAFAEKSYEQTREGKIKERRSHTKRSKEKTIKRVQGFLIETQGEESKVGIVENGELATYIFPVKLLRTNGIDLKNQPFEMDEVLVTENNAAALVYRFRPLADAKDAYKEGVALDDDRRRKLALLLAENAQA